MLKSVVDLIHPDIQAYAEQHTAPEDPLLKEVNDYTRLHHSSYHMLSGYLQGKWLEMISHMLRPRRILEIGTFTGYSALCLAAGMPADGKLHTIELREPDAAVARSFFDRSVYRDQIILHTGNALEIIPTLKESWDLVFIDADKTGYVDYFDMILPRVRPNGFILADNIFFHGQVLDPEPKGKNAKAIKAFNEKIRHHTGVDSLMITIRDGLYLIRKIN